MKNIKCLIVDDEAPARKVVEKFLTDLPGVEIVGQCKNAFEAMEMLSKEKPDLMFLDINMPNLSGIQLLKTLQHPPMVIITTAYREYALESFELDVVDYLHKPFSFERFIKAMNKARAKFDPAEINVNQPVAPKGNESPNYIFIKEDKRNYRVDLKDIEYLQADGDYINVFTKKRTYLVYMTMKKMETVLDKTNLIRVHRSYFVNLSYVTAFEGNRILINDTAIPLGAAYRKYFYDIVKQITI
jgi:DNA-binding LytR/AlgR family response regulator